MPDEPEPKKDDPSGGEGLALKKVDELGNKIDQMANFVLAGFKQQDKPPEPPPSPLKPEPPAAGDEDYVYSLLAGGEEAVEAHKKLVLNIDAKVEERFRQDKEQRKQEENVRKAGAAQQKMANAIYDRHHDMQDTESEQFKRAEQIMAEKGYTPDLSGVILAAEEAAEELGMSRKPRLGVPTPTALPRGGHDVPPGNPEELGELDRKWMKTFRVPEENYKNHKKATRQQAERFQAFVGADRGEG